MGKSAVRRMVPQFVVEVLAGVVFAAFVAWALRIDPAVILAICGPAAALYVAETT